MEIHKVVVRSTDVATTTTSERRTEPTPVAEQHHPETHSEPVSRTITKALASAEDVDTTDLDFELYRSLDVDAVDSLFEHSPSSAEHWSLSFTVREYEVTVEHTGRVTVYEAMQ